MRTIPNFSLALVLVAILTLTACSSGSPKPEDRPLIVASTTIIADVVSQVVGDAATVESVMPPGTDPHDFSLSSADAARIGAASLVVVGGLGLDSMVQDTADAAGTGRLLVLAPLLDPIPFTGAHEDHDGDEDGDHVDEGDLDPHFWQDPDRMARAVEIIAEAVIESLPAADGTAIGARAAAYANELRALDRQLSESFAAIPAARRVVVTNHDALGYFAARYDIRIAAVVLPGGGTLAQPSSAALGDLVETLEGLGVRAIFADNVESSDLARAVAAELGSGVEVIELLTDSLDAERGGGYLDMIEANAEAILSTMR